jgi:F1F0 ATPase subunit 2
MMSEALLAAAWVVGVVLGAFFFGGLWWTVRNGVSSAQPALWFVGSLITRTSVTAAGFYLVAGGRWERALSCLFGFFIASLVVTRWTRTMEDEEAIRAPHS